MKFVHRLGYYLGGFAIGLIFLAFFLSGKKTSCDYGPDARVLKNISTKTHYYTDEVLSEMNSKDIDSLSIANILRHGNVNFSKSDTSLDSCKLYVIEGDHNTYEIELTVANCDSIATISEIRVK